MRRAGLQHWACSAGDMVSDVVLNSKTHKAISSTVRICRLLRRKFEMFTNDPSVRVLSRFGITG